jgi:hypothetical protein
MDLRSPALKLRTGTLSQDVPRISKAHTPEICGCPDERTVGGPIHSSATSAPGGIEDSRMSVGVDAPAGMVGYAPGAETSVILSIAHQAESHPCR